MVAALGRARTLSGKEMKRARARSVDLGQAPQKPRMPLWPVYDPDLSRPRQLQKIAWELLEDPSASKASKAISLFIMGVIVLSVFSFLLAAEFAPPCEWAPPAYDPDVSAAPRFYASRLPFAPGDHRRCGGPGARLGIAMGAETIEAFCIITFTVEYALRFLLCSVAMRRRAFVLQTLNLIDLVAILPWYVERVVMAAGATAELGFLSVLRLVRVVRVFKMSRNFQGFGVLSRTLLRSSTALYLLFVFILTLLIVFSTLMYQFEGPEGPTTYYDAERSQYLRRDGTPSPFRSIPESIYWCITTMTTVGYGDQVPITVLGRTVAVVCMLLGLVVLSLPITIIGSNFEEELREHHRVASRTRRAARRKQIAVDAADRGEGPSDAVPGYDDAAELLRDYRSNCSAELGGVSKRRTEELADNVGRVLRQSSVFRKGTAAAAARERAAREWHATIAAVGGGRGEGAAGWPGAAGAGAAAPDLSKVAAEDQSIAACAKAMLAAEALRAPPRGVDPDAVVACGDAAEAEGAG